MYVSNLTTNEIFLFSKVKFEKDDSKVTFKKCKLGITNFSLTVFDSLIFKDSILNYTKFRTAIIKTKLSISECIFNSKADFSDCYFLGESIFSLTSFHTDTIFQYAHFIDIVRYHNVDFKKQSLVIFNGDLSNVSFIGTDITRIKFSNKIIWCKDDDLYAILDARELIKNPQNFNLSSVLAVYRNLRENYEFYLMYEEAGQFFVKEMDLKRIYFEDSNDKYKTKIKKLRRYFSITNCYNILSTYGESFKRVSLWSIVLFSLALTYFFICPDIAALNKSQPLGDIDYTKLLDDPSYRLKISLERTFGSLFQITTGELADYAVRIASLPILGTMFIVLRRRFERRFRH